MAKKQKKRHKSHGKSQGIMDRSDIPFAQRLSLKKHSDIVNNRDHAAKVVMYCNSVAMHELYGISYKRLVRFHYRFKEVVDEFYEDVAVGMAHAKRRLEQMGRPISGEFYSLEDVCASRRTLEIQNNRLQAAQVALICGAIAMNDVFGFGQERQERIAKRADELSERYNREGDKFLLKEMEKLGFAIVDGEVIAFIDDEGNGITHKQWKELKGL